MADALVYVVVVAVVAAVVYLGAALVFGRGEELAPMPPGATPTRLPSRDLDGSHVRTLRFQLALRGYRMSEVDWALQRLADEVDDLRGRLAAAEAAAGTRPAPPPGGTGPGDEPDPRVDDAPTADPDRDPIPEVRHGHP